MESEIKEAYDDVAEAGESLRYGHGEVNRNDSLETLLIELFVKYVVTSVLVGV